MYSQVESIHLLNQTKPSKTNQFSSSPLLQASSLENALQHLRVGWQAGDSRAFTGRGYRGWDQINPHLPWTPNMASRSKILQQIGIRRARAEVPLSRSGVAIKGFTPRCILGNSSKRKHHDQKCVWERALNKRCCYKSFPSDQRCKRLPPAFSTSRRHSMIEWWNFHQTQIDLDYF